MATLPSVLRFEDTELSVIDRNGRPWVRGYQIGSALGYTQPDAAISKIYERNTGEFTDDMTAVVEMDTAGGKQKVRIFSPRGCHLIGMFARTDRAKAFRRWVLDVLDKVAANSAVTPAISKRQEEVNLRLVREARRDFGPAAALALWKKLALPWVPEMEPAQVRLALPAPRPGIDRDGLGALRITGKVVTFDINDFHPSPSGTEMLVAGPDDEAEGAPFVATVYPSNFYAYRERSVFSEPRPNPALGPDATSRRCYFAIGRVLSSKKEG